MAFSTRIEKVCKFRLENNVFISATEEIDATELQTYIIDLVKDGLLPPQTVFYLIGGIHHGLNRDGEAIEGQTDFTLLHGFYHQVYTNASKLDSWKEKKYDFVLVPVTCSAEIDYQTWRETYKLSDISKNELSRLARKLLKGKKPSLVVFASCFSFNSTIKDFLFSKGVMASLSLSYDKGQVTEGKSFSLDKDQQDVIRDYDEVRHNDYFAFELLES